MSFKIGDQVRYKGHYGPRNRIGTIKYITGDGSFAVDFSGFNTGHDCDHQCGSRSGWWCGHNELEYVNSAQVPRKGIVKFWKANKLVA